MKHYLFHTWTWFLMYTWKKFNNAKTPDRSCNRILFQGCGTDTSAACQPHEMCTLCQISSAGRQWKLEAIWSDVWQYSIAHRNLELHLIPLHWSKVVLKIISPYAADCRAKSGTAAWCSLSNLLCLDKLVACFPVVEKHFYDFAPFQWLAGDIITACLYLL